MVKDKSFDFVAILFCIYEFTHVILRSVSLLSATRFFSRNYCRKRGEVLGAIDELK